MTERNVLRWEIPVDDQWHVPPFVGSIVHIASRDPFKVEIWTSPDVSVARTTTGTGKILEERISGWSTKPNEREFKVFGTGHPVEGLYHGTAVIGALVWHLFSRIAKEDE